MKRILFVRHGVCEDGDIPMGERGVSQVKKLAGIIALTKDERKYGDSQITFCSRLIRGVQTARLVTLNHEPIIALDPLRCGEKVKHELLNDFFMEMLSIAEMFKKNVAVVVCHGYLTTIFAEFASEKVSGVSIRGTLPQFPEYANGYSVDMKTGEVTAVVNT
jgi:hypothetical protein